MVNLNFFLSILLFLDPTVQSDYKTEHCSLFLSGLPDNDYNRVFCASMPTSEEVLQVKNFFGNIPYSWPVHVEDYDMQKFLREQGLVKIPQSLPTSPLMVLDLNDFHFDNQINHNFIIHQVDILQEDQIREWIACKLGVESLYHEQFYKFLQLLLERFAGNIKLYIGYYQDQPAVTTMIIEHIDVISIHSVFTVHQLRKNGLACIMLNHVLQEAQQNGCKQAALISSAFGKSLYERLGFQEKATYLMYGNYASDL